MSNQTHIYEIRFQGKTVCSWTDPCCCYTKEALKSLKANGYQYYIDGKLQR